MRRTIAALLLMLQALACTSWKVSRLAPDSTVREESRVLLTLKHGEPLELHEPWVRSDSIGGRVGTLTWAVPLDLVESVKVRRFDTWATVAVVGIPLLFLGFMGAVVGSPFEGDTLRLF